MRMCYDPGHAGKGIDPGAVGSTGLFESDVALAVCLELERLTIQEGHEVLMTRRTESDEASDSLRYRTDLSNQGYSDVFISVHCNAATTDKAQGTETYYFPFSPNGRELAQAVQRELVPSLGTVDRGIKSANLWVIRYTNCPAILVELAFISNPEDESKLLSDHFRKEAANAIWRGIKSYLGISTQEPEKPNTDEIQAPQEQPPQQVESREDWSDAGLRNRMSERG